MRLRVWFLAFVLTSCHGASTAEAARATSRKTTKAAGKPAGARLYRQGVRYQPVAGDDRYTCWGTAKAAASCRKLQPRASCLLVPPAGFWEGEPYCRGIPPDDDYQLRRIARIESLAIPVCVCGCSEEYARAAASYRERVERCGEHP